MRYKRPSNTPHVITTEAQSLEEAVDILRAQKANKRRSEAQKRGWANGHKQSLKSELNTAKFRARHLPISLSPVAGSRSKTDTPNQKYLEKNKIIHPPHPFHSLPRDEQIAKAKELFASGHWGKGSRAGRNLARTFGVSNETMTEWLGFPVMSLKVENKFNAMVREHSRELAELNQRLGETVKRMRWLEAKLKSRQRGMPEPGE